MVTGKIFRKSSNNLVETSESKGTKLIETQVKNLEALNGFWDPSMISGARIDLTQNLRQSQLLFSESPAVDQVSLASADVVACGCTHAYRYY